MVKALNLSFSASPEFDANLKLSVVKFANQYEICTLAWRCFPGKGDPHRQQFIKQTEEVKFLGKKIIQYISTMIKNE